MNSKFFEYLFNFKPHVYAYVYLSLIPLFALIYSLLPRDFYQSTAKFEYLILNEKSDEILKEMKSQIQFHYKKNILKKQSTDSTQLFAIDDISLSSLNFDKNRFSLKLGFGEQFRVDNEDTIYDFMKESCDISFSLNSMKHNIETSSEQKQFLREIKLENRIGMFDMTYFSERFYALFNTKKLGPRILVVDKNLNNKLIEFANTISGFPISFSENYWRMFYFSSVTLTTLGFGDIVPVTNRARNIISVEAILGVVLIGLFLNSLTTKSKD
jgi:hypothetical protein